MAPDSLQQGRYLRLRPLGSGSMGEVYLMEDTRIHRQVAIKVIRSESSPYPSSEGATDAARLFQREARAIAALDHPNILPLYDFGEEHLGENILTYMVMPFCAEGSFANWLRQHASSSLLKLQDAAYFIDQAADALQYAHNHQVLHLDVKSSNFLLRGNQRNADRPILLLADFGVAKISATTSSSSRTVRGTPIAMAPEQWSGEPVPASDQYALAVMAYQLLVGRSPFLGGLEQLMYQHFHTQPLPPSTLKQELSGAIDAVILRGLAKDPQDRFPTILAFASAFNQALQVLPTEPALTLQPLEESVIRATLVVSHEEARNGTSRTLTLPGERRLTVTIPPGTSDGEVIRLQNVDETSHSSDTTGDLVVTIAVRQAEEADLPVSPGNDEPTILASQRVPNDQNPTKTLSTPGGSTSPRPPLAKRNILLPIGLALLVIVSGIGLFSLIHANTGGTATAGAGATGSPAKTSSNRTPAPISVGPHPTIVIQGDTNVPITVIASAINAISFQTGQDSSSAISYQRSGSDQNIITFDLSSFSGNAFEMVVPTSANLQINTTGGDIAINGLNGQMSVESSGGNITVVGVTLTGHSSFTSENGDISFKGALDPQGTFSFSTHSGNISLTLPRSSAFHLDATTQFGSIISDFSQVSVSNTGANSQAHGDVGQAPRAQLGARSSAGDISIFAS